MIHTPKNQGIALAEPKKAALILADGTVFEGFSFGKSEKTFGEICFNTAMTGYQEILTDPSYAGQIITFTFPHIGNVGMNEEDIECKTPHASGLVVRAKPTLPSNFRSETSLDQWCEKNNISGIYGIDTRALTRHIRTKGAQNVAIVSGEYKADAVVKEIQAQPSMKGLDLAKNVTGKKASEWKEPVWALGGKSKPAKATYNVVALDYGCKQNILRVLVSYGCNVTVVPAETSAKDILKLKPDGVFLSNGPGDPAATGVYAIPTIQEILESQTPVLGICLGHQMLGLALGAKTEKMKQGHRGANHPVQDLRTKKVEITSQNHGFVVSDEKLPSTIEVTHRSLFDGTIQGIRAKNYVAFSVQGHPEASPGPHDTHYMFQEFVDAMTANQKSETKKKVSK
jgi:carbamoyl-phosphate synthase small subunit